MVDPHGTAPRNSRCKRGLSLFEFGSILVAAAGTAPASSRLSSGCSLLSLTAIIAVPDTSSGACYHKMESDGTPPGSERGLGSRSSARSGTRHRCCPCPSTVISRSGFIRPSRTAGADEQSGSDSWTRPSAIGLMRANAFPRIAMVPKRGTSPRHPEYQSGGPI